ncbi:hypothetical protein TrVE_jg9812 [Triparma verrucosa]|uniref:Chloride channel protein n=1 Tax=Triparma verrucosa TaxID=1606542 RepID=A0A9W7C8H2_9STRA|nr:hypothetical protein TrVE_jg9812 [Triparma verrucosa]
MDDSQNSTEHGLLPPGFRSSSPSSKRKSPLRSRRSIFHSTASPHHAPNVAPPSVESHNYEPDESEVWRAANHRMNNLNRGQWWTTGKRRSIRRWMLTIIVGVLQGLIAYFCNMLSRKLSTTKWTYVYAALQDEVKGEAWSGKAYFLFLLYQTFYVSIASFMVYLEPVSAGSGIPEVKCFLNGIALPRIVRIKTLFCKVLGVTFSVAAGLPVGKEGPMVHSGAVVASAISQGKTQVCGVDTSFTKIDAFRNDKEKRDFVACGAAAGVCSAFSAPIGGVLFALEEGASYWSTKLTWRVFFCSMMTLLTLYSVKNLDTWWGQASTEKLFSFGEFASLSDGEVNFSIWELFLFSVIGCLGGLIGACFNATNEHITIWRMKHVNHSKLRRVSEVMAVSFLVTTVSFLMPTIWGRCTELPVDVEDWSDQEKELVDALVPFKCQAGKEYNEVASLIFTDADDAIKQLFHFREAGEDDASTFSSAALFLFFMPYISLATLVYGIAVPSGLFVPSLLSGAAFGRLCGHLLHKLDHTQGTFADSGSYALMGAAAVLGGMARMTISLTVILLEATGDMQYVLPLMLTLMCARFTGNVFNEGLYDIHIHLKRIPFLEQDAPEICEHHEIVANQVMSSDVKCIRPVERVGVIHDLLSSYGHSNFPIIDEHGTLYGTASRNMLCTLLKHRAFSKSSDNNMNPLGPRRVSPLLTFSEIESVYPRYPTIADCRLAPEDRSCFVDLRPYANTAAYTINETASCQRTYRLFRTMGLRFLSVCNHENKIVGVITRKDLLPEALLESLIRVRRPGRELGGGDDELGDSGESSGAIALGTRL